MQSAARKAETKRYRKRNTAKRRKQNKRWRQLNPTFDQVNARLRRIGLKSAMPIWHEKDLIVELYKKRDYLNKLWTLKGKERFAVDHIIPLQPQDKSVCGLHCFANLQLLRIAENSRKNDSYITDW